MIFDAKVKKMRKNSMKLEKFVFNNQLRKL